jgi:hypothetical protein
LTPKEKLHVKKATLVSAAVLVLASAVPAGAEESKRPVMTTSTAQQGGKLAIKTPFNVWPDGNWIFVVNVGATDWTAALDVYAACTPVAPTTSCGPNFVAGKYLAGHYDKGHFPKGHGNTPSKGSPNQQVSGPGWVAVMMGLPAGSYKITATAANNTSAETAVTIAGAPSGPVVQVQPGVVPVVKPTKTP